MQTGKEDSLESRELENFIACLREAAGKISSFEKRENILQSSAQFFAAFSQASNTLIVDLSRESFELYRGIREDLGSQESSMVILQESIVPVLELLQDRYLEDAGIRVFQHKILDAPEGIDEELLSSAFENLGISQGFILPLCLPRKFGIERVSGILLINNVPSTKFADPSHLAILRFASEFLCAVSDNIIMADALARIRPSDQATGTCSPNRFKSLLSEEIQRASYLNRSFALVYIDVDDFRYFNMRQGYRYGDLVIKTVAEDLKAESRPIDTVCRWTGGGFLTLLPEAEQGTATDFAERCRKRIETHGLSPNDYQEELFATVSAGVIVYPEHANSIELLLRYVDLALLQAKLNGRNQTQVWSAELLNPKIIDGSN
ncbi:MAG: GGDEF domain-containing protein [Candidatus Obscuribacterales bacterium]|nr:GGDEF domain-containing protein [Candidatus Obscuribacterales bacterium]